MAPDLGLDLKLSASKIVANLSKDAGAGDGDGRRIAKLEEYVANLEEERRKIEVFKRELPLCMFLLDDVIGGMKSEVEQCRRAKPRVLEEFMPVKSKLDEGAGVKLEKDCKDKMNWMSSAQLWSDNHTVATKKDSESAGEEDSGRRQESDVSPSLEPKSKAGGAFTPFKREAIAGGLPDLSLVSRPVPLVPEDHHHRSFSATAASPKPVAVRCPVSSPAGSGGHVGLQSPQQPPRKARRCWSPELHRRFVIALQQLGGAQVATPKQIRELMKVDGLTNDEVKSHLQKYRLHTRRVSASSSSSASRPVAVMGGMWAPPDRYPSSSQQSASQSASPQGPLQLTGSSRAISVTAGDSCDEDGKSESYSWK